ncbi:hypothetical protein [Calycomorphotria hydatis]|uniref:Uncharacterized protein n=1 Tax=Calycomorphotria hydatis TaxID=2528027 RepID=A0A517TBR3_9PLAN|nr:hypothetical protein [Calycomorphotria hydatis]QDT65815.1 hypothetical protein V22_30770 [Calycomorphotria hydatis]
MKFITMINDLVTVLLGLCILVFTLGWIKLLGIPLMISGVRLLIKKGKGNGGRNRQPSSSGMEYQAATGQPEWDRDIRRASSADSLRGLQPEHGDFYAGRDRGRSEGEDAEASLPRVPSGLDL